MESNCEAVAKEGVVLMARTLRWQHEATDGSSALNDIQPMELNCDGSKEKGGGSYGQEAAKDP